MSNLTVSKPLLSFSSYNPGKRVKELTISYGWRQSFHPTHATHLFLWREDLDNIQKSEQFSHLEKRKKKESRNYEKDA